MSRQLSPWSRPTSTKSSYENRIGKLTSSERLYVSALAHLGDGPQRVGAIANLLRRSTTSLSPLRDDTMRSAVIYSPRRGYVDFTAPHCATFVTPQLSLPTHRRVVEPGLYRSMARL